MDETIPQQPTPVGTPVVPPTPTNRKSVSILVASVVCVAVLGIGIWYTFSFSKDPTIKLTTYFDYTEAELSALKGLSSNQFLVVDDLYRWDQAAFDTVALEKVRDVGGDASKVYAYLAVAQRDFAFLSFNATGEFKGNFDRLSKDIICRFFKEQCLGIVLKGGEDVFSTALSNIVMAKVLARIEQDTSGLKEYPLKIEKEYWDGPQPSAGIQAGSSLGWFIASGSQFRAAPPPDFDSEEFKNQLTMTKQALANATPEQKRATVLWAGVPGTKTPPGQILQLGNEYMQEKSVPLSKALLVRSVLTMAVADAVTAVFDSKYTYQVKRPFMMDSSIKTIIPTPNHPSYPAGHSTLSMAGVTVLKHYFPEDTVMWETEAFEAGMSRVWGGIHYSMDHEAGVVMGKSVGTAAFEAQSSI